MSSETGVTFNVTALNQLSVLQTLNTSLNAKMIDLSGKMQAVSAKLQEVGNKITTELKSGLLSIKDATKEVSMTLQKGFAILVASDVRSKGGMTKAQEKIIGGTLLREEDGEGEDAGVAKRVSDITKGVLDMLKPAEDVMASLGEMSTSLNQIQPLSETLSVTLGNTISSLSRIKLPDFVRPLSETGSKVFPDQSRIGMKESRSSPSLLSPSKYTDPVFQSPSGEKSESGAEPSKLAGGMNALFNPFEKLAKIGPAMGKAFKEIGTQFGGMIKATLFMQPLMSALGALLAPFEPITEIVTSFGEILGMAFLPIVQALVPALTNLLPGFFAISNALSGPIQEAVNYLTPVLEKFWGVLEQLWATLEPVLAQLWEALQPVFDMIGQLITEGFDWLGEILIQLAPVITQIVEVFIALMPVIMPIIEIILRINMLITQLVTGVIVSVITTIVNIITKSEALKNIFDSVVNGIAKFLESIQKLLGWLMGNQDGGNKSWWNWAG